MTITKDAEGFWQSDQTPSELGGTMIVENWILASSKIAALESADLLALLQSANLSDLADAPTARTNLGNVQTDTEVAALIAAAGHLALAGGTMLGALTLAGAPTVDLHAATKKYVDDNVGGGGGGSSQGHHAIGRLYGNHAIAGGAVAGLAPNKLYAIPIVLNTDRTYNALFVRGAGPPAINHRLRIGLYAADANGGDPGTLLAETGQILPSDAMLSGAISHSPSSSFAWLALQVDGDPGDVRRGNGTFAEHLQLGTEDLTDGLLPDYYLRDAATSGGSMPDPFGAGSLIVDPTTQPALWIRPGS